MTEKILLIACLALTVMTGMGGESAFSVTPGCVIKAEEIPFRLYHWGRDWKNGTAQNPGNVTFPGEGGTVRNGTFQVHGGSFSYRESVKLSIENEAELKLELSHPDGIETQSLVLSAELPFEVLKQRPILLNGKEVRFGEAWNSANAQHRIWAKNKQNTVTIPLNGGMLNISGVFSAQLQDNRRYKRQSCGLRLLFADGSGKVKQARLACKMTYRPYESTPLAISGAANRAFRDERADDHQGSWNDQGPGNDLRMVPAGEHKWGGLRFRILDHAGNGGRTCISLRGKARPELPQEASIPGQGKSGQYLYLLNALGWEPTKETPVGKITVLYENGTRDILPVVSGVHTANFWTPRELREGVAVWRGENDCASVGLYASKFKLSGGPIRQITFHSDGNAVWMIAAVTIAEEDIVPEIRGPLTITANIDWRPIKNQKEILPGSIVDFSDTLEKPAGRHGFLKVVGSHFEFEKRPGKPVRFYGINNIGQTNFMEHDLTRRMADELAATGYNLIRLHHFDNLLVKRGNGSSTSLDPEKLDQLDYLLAECSKRGIYTTLDLFTARKLEKGEIPEYPDRALSPTEFKALAFINANVMKNLETFSANLLNHVNPYTGLAWKEDPAIITISLINEDTLSQVLSNSSFARALYEKEFEKYLKRKKIAVTASDRNQYYQRFLSEVYLRGWRHLSAFVRNLGVKVPLTDLNYINDIPSTLSRNHFDFVDIHSYWAHPLFLGPNWRLPASVNPESAIPNYAGAISNIFSSRIFGKPFAITEWDYAFPNPFSVEGAFLAGAYAALQDYSQLCRFDYSWTPEKVRQAESHLCFFDIANDPLRLLSERAGVLFFLRGDVAVSRSSYPFYVSPDALSRRGYPRYYSRMVSRIGLIGRTGTVFSTSSLPAGTRAVLTSVPEKIQTESPVIVCRSIRESFDELLKNGAITPREYDEKQQRFTSSTGELVLNRRAGSFQVATSRSEGYVAPPGIRLSGGFATVTNKYAFAAVLVASRDGLELAESRRILILHLTTLMNTNTKFSNQAMSVLERYGTTPLLMRRGEAEISLRTAGKVKLFACAFSGKRLFEVKTASRNGQLHFTARNITPHGAIAVYELVKE